MKKDLFLSISSVAQNYSKDFQRGQVSHLEKQWCYLEKPTLQLTVCSKTGWALLQSKPTPQQQSSSAALFPTCPPLEGDMLSLTELFSLCKTYMYVDILRRRQEKRHQGKYQTLPLNLNIKMWANLFQQPLPSWFKNQFQFSRLKHNICQHYKDGLAKRGLLQQHRTVRSKIEVT